MSGYFPIPVGKNVKIVSDLYDYATKEDWKNAAGVDTSKFNKKVDLASSELEIDNLDIGQTETTQLSDIVENDVKKPQCID